MRNLTDRPMPGVGARVAATRARSVGGGLVALALVLGGGCELVTGSSGDRGPRYEAIVAGGSQTCALSVGGTWYCWGYSDAYRALDSGSGVEAPATSQDDEWVRPVPWSRPVARFPEPGFREISLGVAFGCRLTDEGEAHCWGRNSLGELGRGFLSPSHLEHHRPYPVLTDVRFERLASAGGSASHMCGLDFEGHAHCWGNNWRRQLGAGVPESRWPLVEEVQGGHRFAQITVEEASTCALTEERDYVCWGALVRGPENDLHEPTLVVPETGFDTLVARHGVRCALREQRAYCHGVNEVGGLGTGDSIPHEGFVAVAGGHRFRELSAGRVHVCGITTEGEAWCWGWGRFGRLGTGSEEDALTPSRVVGGHRWRALAAGGEHTCGLTERGRVYCWGLGRHGGIGNGATEDQLVPTPIAAPMEHSWEPSGESDG